jgi:hypothetical protein
LFAGFLACIALLAFAPCSWFGSSFEGACGLAGGLVALFLGVVVFFITLGILLWLTLIRRVNFPHIQNPFTLKILVVCWVIMAVSQYLHWFFLFFWLPGLYVLTPFVVQAMLVGLVVVSALLAPARRQHPFLSLAALVPLVGPMIVAFVLFAQPAAVRKVPSPLTDGSTQGEV